MRRVSADRQHQRITALVRYLLIVLVALATTTLADSARSAAAASCPAGSRAITFTNNCTTDVYLGENLSQPQVDGTPSCTLDSDCTNGTVFPNLKCVAGVASASSGLCTITCSSDSDCGPNQACFQGNLPGSSHAWYDVNSTDTVGECWFANLEPTPLSSPTPSSNWDLPPNGGQSVICVPEAQEASQKSAVGSSCTQPSDCASDSCYDVNAPAHSCTSGDPNCTCGALFTWSGNFWGRTGCTANNNGSLTCQTGNCGAGNGAAGLADCSGSTSGTPVGGQNPENLSEFTLLNPTDGGDTYDTSMVNGFNVGFSVAPVSGTYTGSPSKGYCTSPGAGCSFDLLQTCPAQLALKDGNNDTVGCWAPAQACQSGTPAQQAALGCTSNVPFLCQTQSDCPYGQQTTPTHMNCSISAGQAFGQCQCSADTDCPCGYSCTSGACTLNSVSGTTATWADLYGCANYFGQLTPYGSPGASGNCPAPSKTSLEAGLVCGCPSWSPDGTCLADNVNWEKVPVGSTSPVPSPAPTTSVGDFYLLFHNACATSYAYPYDDNAGTIGCAAATDASVGPSYNITFCPAGSGPSPTATPTSTATATPSPTASPTPGPTTSPTLTATPSPTATVTATASQTSTATSTATPTATSTPSLTPTATATATSSATPTATPTMTPTPSGTPTPRCTPSFLYLTTNPAGTLAFPATTVGHPRTATLTVSSSAPVELLKLSTKITGTDAKDFSVTGGSCKTSKKLKPNASCTYKVKLKAKKQFLDAVDANLEITAMFRPGVCPAGDVENVGVTLAGNVDEIASH
jgi:hypothetical protein